MYIYPPPIPPLPSIETKIPLTPPFVDFLGFFFSFLIIAALLSKSYLSLCMFPVHMHLSLVGSTHALTDNEYIYIYPLYS